MWTLGNGPKVFLYLQIDQNTSVWSQGVLNIQVTFVLVTQNYSQDTR